MPYLPLSSHFLLTYILYAKLHAKPRACGQMTHISGNPPGRRTACSGGSCRCRYVVGRALRFLPEGKERMRELGDLRAGKPLGKAACGSAPKTTPDKGFLPLCSAYPGDQAGQMSVLRVREGSSNSIELKVFLIWGLLLFALVLPAELLRASNM